MKTPLLRLALTLLLALPAAPLLRAQQKHEHKEPDTELGKVMEKVGHAWRTVRKQVENPADNAATLALVTEIQGNLEKALQLEPVRANDVPAAERAKFVESYRAHLKDFLGLVSQLETALKANDNAAAADLVKKMGAAQRENHKEFRRPEE
ncbi:MAG TPA: cytochrome b562 [Lacunisphaera sp.]|nr:cytochrome b562 [Lacunisphaera sp.]